MLIRIPLALILLLLNLHAEQAPMKLADILAWKRIQAPTVSNDGKWFAYKLAPNDGDTDVVLKNLTTGAEQRFAMGELPRPEGFGPPVAAPVRDLAFSDDSKWFALQAYATVKEARQLKKQRKPLQTKLLLVELASGKKMEFEAIRRFSFSGGRSSAIALQRYPPTPASTASPIGAGIPSAPSTGSPTKPDDRPQGSDMILHNLATGSDLNFGNVSDFAFNKKGDALAWLVDAQDKIGNGVQTLNLLTGAITPLDSAKAIYKGVNWAERGDALATLRGVDDKAWEDKLYSVVAFSGLGSASAPQKFVYDPTQDKSFPSGMTISPTRNASWMADLSLVTFGIHEIKAKVQKDARKDAKTDDAADVAVDKPDLSIWHWKDDRLQSMQQVQENTDKNFSYLSAFVPSANKFVRLGDGQMRQVSAAPEHKFALGVDVREYELMSNLDGKRYQDIYKVDLKTGERQVALRKARYFMGPSPDGARILYYDEGAFFTYNSPPDWLGVRLLYELAIRPVYFAGQEPFVAAMLDVRSTRLIERTAAELMEDGVCLKGVYIGKRVPSEDPRIAPDFELLGCVRSVEGSQLLLTDSRDGIEVVEAGEVRPARDEFATCLSHVFKECAPGIAAALECQRAALRQGPERLDRIRSVLDTLRKRQHEMAPGAPFTFGPLLDDSVRAFPHLETAPRPVYVYDGRGSKTHKWHDEGLNIHGPYSANVQTIAPPRICVICQRSQRGQVDQFLRKFFFDGVNLPPPSPRYKGKPAKNYFDRGLCRKYVLGTVHYEYFLAEGASADSYRKACQEALEKHGNGQPWDMALIQIEEAFHELPPESNPYFVAKLSFQTLQILVQEFKIETARKWASQLSFCLNNMGLATYAKLGGTPWLLKANSKGLHEFVIGIGSAEVGVGRLGKREKLIGITTVFGGDGNYHLSNLSKAVPIDEYQDALLKTLRAAVSNVQVGMNWQRGDRVLFVFHGKFKRFSNKEVRAVVDLISEFEEYDVKYAFVQVSDQHPYMAFDTSQDGVMDFETRRSKGQYAPTRGKYLQLGNRDVLLFLTGPNEVKRPEDGTPRPLLLSLHRDSSFTELPYLAEQSYAFACHSWRTFLPGSLPVTIQYPNLIAKSLGKLSRLDRWNPDVMLDRIGKTMWFL